MQRLMWKQAVLGIFKDKQGGPSDWHNMNKGKSNRIRSQGKREDTAHIEPCKSWHTLQNLLRERQEDTRSF